MPSNTNRDAVTAGLIARIEAGERSNELDLAVELALFKPTKNWPSARANTARTKIIYVAKDGSEETCWPREWEHYPDVIAALAKARPSTGEMP